jgi:nucleoside-diphosphate-sugar epimerase
MYPFERFTESAKRVLTLAQEEAERSHHSYIGTEHLLLGLMRDQDGRAAQVLQNLGLEIDKVRVAIASVLGRSERIIIQQIIPTSRVKKVIEISFEEARRLGSQYVGSEHLLLGLVIEGEGVAAHVMADLGATRPRVAAEINRLASLAVSPGPINTGRVLILGGTGFIGRALVEELAVTGHQLMLVHRGLHEPPDLPPAEHVHVDRLDLHTVRDALHAFMPDAVVDSRALTRKEALFAIAELPREVRLVLLSSGDVYRAYGGLHAGLDTDAVPLDETAPLRVDRYPYRGKLPGLDDYEKLDVEEVYGLRGATICRLPAVYGEHDYQRREEFILRRVRAGRARIPIGAGTLLFSRGYVRDMARGIRLALHSPAAPRQVFNFAERQTWSIALLARKILEAAGADAELVRVRDESVLPTDLEITKTASQHLLMDATKARTQLGWADTDPIEALRRTVAWHLAHHPEDTDPDFAADDRALASES